MALARAYERRQSASTEISAASNRLPARPSQRAPAPTPKTAPPSGTPGSTPATPGAPLKSTTAPDGRFKRLSPEEMAQRRLDGLCFNCPEKFSRDHLKHCSGKGIYLLELAADEESPEGSDSDDDLQISVAAITGIHTNAMLHLAANICDTHAVALVDSGSTHVHRRVAGASSRPQAGAPSRPLRWRGEWGPCGIGGFVQGRTPLHRQGRVHD